MSPEVRELSSLPFSMVRVGAQAAGAVSAQEEARPALPCPAELWEEAQRCPSR